MTYDYAIKLRAFGTWTSARRVAMMICCDCPSPRPVLMIRTPTTSPEVRASVHTWECHRQRQDRTRGSRIKGRTCRAW
eukprot:1338702-Rhodomonas_salina.3